MLVVLGLDPGITTGWALVDATGDVNGSGDVADEDLGEVLDHLIRGVNRAGHDLEVVIEQMPSTGGTGDLAICLEAIRRRIVKWVEDIYMCPTRYVKPGEWKTSRAAKMARLKRGLSTHQRDAIRIALYHLDTREVTQ